VYAVCSVLEDEGPAVAAALVAEGGWRLDAEFALTPGTHGCDGFYVARLVPI
jgi:16S rRNA C967 or C1407 C5-methylase (RsmB/RsmF family)